MLHRSLSIDVTRIYYRKQHILTIWLFPFQPWSTQLSTLGNLLRLIWLFRSAKTNFLRHKYKPHNMNDYQKSIQEIRSKRKKRFLRWGFKYGGKIEILWNPLIPKKSQTSWDVCSSSKKARRWNLRLQDASASWVENTRAHQSRFLMFQIFLP